MCNSRPTVADFIVFMGLRESDGGFENTLLNFTGDFKPIGDYTI